MDSGKSAAGKQSKPSHFDAAARGATANRRFITPEPGMSQEVLSESMSGDRFDWRAP
jgi:hypothetical protein